MTKSKKEIVNKLTEDTKKGILDWVVNFTNQFITATSHVMLTEKKYITFKVVYYLENDKITKLSVLLSRKDKNGKIRIFEEIYSIGGKKKKMDSKSVNYLFNEILKREETREKEVRDEDMFGENEEENYGDQYEKRIYRFTDIEKNSDIKIL
jgi:hypothetical protein